MTARRHDDVVRVGRLELGCQFVPRPPDAGPVLGIGEFTIDKLAAYEGGDLVRMGRYRDAEPSLDAAIDQLSPYLQRHRCTALIDRAEAARGLWHNILVATTQPVAHSKGHPT